MIATKNFVREEVAALAVSSDSYAKALVADALAGIEKRLGKPEEKKTSSFDVMFGFRNASRTVEDRLATLEERVNLLLDHFNLTVNRTSAKTALKRRKADSY